MQMIALSEDAVAVLRFEIKGQRAKNKESRLLAYRELAAAGIMEPVPGSDTDYRFTAEGLAQRDEILEREQDRIERERFEPPDTSNLSGHAWSLLRRIVAGDRIEITPQSKPAFRELAAARIIYLMHTFAKGDESGYRFSYHGWHQRAELLESGPSENKA